MCAASTRPPNAASSWLAAFNPQDGKQITLPSAGSWPEMPHRFDDDSIWAVRAALAANRPLLIRGEPGLGKSQLARAIAVEAKVPFLSYTITARTECEDLLYSFDAVSRLAAAQLRGALGSAPTALSTPSANSNEAPQVGGLDELDEKRFILPGVLWWALNWTSAKTQNDTTSRRKGPTPEPLKDWQESSSAVVLIDEIDKADADVPNGLLESLGNTGFTVPPTGQAVRAPKGTRPPLVVVTTNEERELPAAFVRRCFVYQMWFPKGDADQEEFLKKRARVHFTSDAAADSVLALAAKQLISDRKSAGSTAAYRPGAAEFLDLIQALVELHPGDPESQGKALKKISGLAFGKNPVEGR